MKYTISIPDPCHEKWHEMTPTEKGRFCASCEKEVFDFTRTSNYQMATILENTQKVCGRFRKDQLDREYSSPHSKRFHRTGLLFGITSLLALCTPAQAQEQSAKIEEVVVTLGEVAVEPEEKQKDVVSQIIAGTVVDENNLPLPGANIVLEGTQIGTQTDFDGNFRLEIPATMDAKPHKIVVSYIGFISQELNPDLLAETPKIMLKEDMIALGELIIIGSVVKKPNIFKRFINLFKKRYDNSFDVQEQLSKVEEVVSLGEVAIKESNSPQYDNPIKEPFDIHNIHIEELEIIEYEEELNNEVKIKTEQKINFWPNPINSSLNVSFEMPVEGTFSAYLVPINNVLNNSVHLANELKSKGNHQVTLNVENVEKGLYVLVLQTGDTLEKHKVIVDHK